MYKNSWLSVSHHPYKRYSHTPIYSVHEMATNNPAHPRAGHKLVYPTTEPWRGVECPYRSLVLKRSPAAPSQEALSYGHHPLLPYDLHTTTMLTHEWAPGIQTRGGVFELRTMHHHQHAIVHTYHLSAWETFNRGIQKEKLTRNMSGTPYRRRVVTTKFHIIFLQKYPWTQMKDHNSHKCTRTVSLLFYMNNATGTDQVDYNHFSTNCYCNLWINN